MMTLINKYNIKNDIYNNNNNNNNNISLLQTHGPYTYKKMLNIYKYSNNNNNNNNNNSKISQNRNSAN